MPSSPTYDCDDLIGPCRLTLGEIEFIHGGYVQVDKKDVFHEQIYHNTKVFIKRDDKVKVIEANQYAPGPAVGHHAVVLEDKILVFAGYYRKNYWFENRDNSVFVFDNRTEQWVDPKMVHFHEKFHLPEIIPNKDQDTPRIFIGTRRQLDNINRRAELVEPEQDSGVIHLANQDTRAIHFDEPVKWIQAFERYTLMGEIPDDFDHLCGLLVMARTYDNEELREKVAHKILNTSAPCAALAIVGWYRAHSAGNERVCQKIAKDCLKMGKECVGKEMEILQSQGLLVQFFSDMFS